MITRPVELSLGNLPVAVLVQALDEPIRRAALRPLRTSPTG
jgi:hypothetical protein